MRRPGAAAAPRAGGVAAAGTQWLARWGRGWGECANPSAPPGNVPCPAPPALRAGAGGHLCKGNHTGAVHRAAAEWVPTCCGGGVLAGCPLCVRPCPRRCALCVRPCSGAPLLAASPRSHARGPGSAAGRAEQRRRAVQAEAAGGAWCAPCLPGLWPLARHARSLPWLALGNRSDGAPPSHCNSALPAAAAAAWAACVLHLPLKALERLHAWVCLQVGHSFSELACLGRSMPVAPLAAPC